MDFPGGSDGKASVYNVRDLGSIPGLGDSLEKEMATHSSTLALKIPWTEELGAGYYPWGRKELGTTERLHFHFTPWKENYDQPRQHIQKQRHYFANKGLSSQGYGFSSSHVGM